MKTLSLFVYQHQGQPINPRRTVLCGQSTSKPSLTTKLSPPLAFNMGTMNARMAFEMTNSIPNFDVTPQTEIVRSVNNYKGSKGPLISPKILKTINYH